MYYFYVIMNFGLLKMFNFKNLKFKVNKPQQTDAKRYKKHNNDTFTIHVTCN